MIEEAYNNFIEEAELFFVKKFVSMPEIKKVYSDCLDIVYNLTGQIDAGRGFIAYNPRYGQGKSFFFEVVQHRHRRRRGNNKFVWTTARELCEIYTSAGKSDDPLKNLSKFIHVKELFIDDIGDELKDGKERSHYGNKLNVVRWVLLRRYELWQQKGWRTFGTTNLTIGEISQAYDGRVADRIKQMVHWCSFNFLPEKGSFRQIKGTRRLTQSEIEENWKKFETPAKKATAVDKVKFFNELIEEEDDYIKSRDLMFWEFTKQFLEEQEILTAKDYDGINEQALIVSEMKLTEETRDYQNNRAKYAPAGQRKNQMNIAMSEINKGMIYDTAKVIVAKQKFMELREKKHKFI